MAWMRLATSGGGLAYLELDAVDAADGEGLVVSAVRVANLSDRTLRVDVQRANRASVFSGTVPAGTAETSQNLNGSVSNRTVRHIFTSWER